MRFLLDQSSDARLVPYLQSLGHDAKRVGADFPGGISDERVLSLAVDEERIVITDDRDFGELIVRRGLSHRGVIYLRLGNDADLRFKMGRLDVALEHYPETPAFLVVDRNEIRVRS